MAASCNDIGVVYKKKGDLENALLQHQRALEIRTRVLGHDHPNVADSLFNLALVYADKEEWEKVVDCYQQVYDIESKIFGQDHTQVKETLEALNEAKQHLK